MTHKMSFGNGRGISTMIAAVVIIVALVVGIAAGYYVAPTKTTTTTQARLNGVILIGAALPLSGPLGTYGQNGLAALNLAKTQINNLLQASGAGYSLNLSVIDTKTDPATALTATQTLYGKGCQIILGYYSSGELSQCISYAQTNNIILVSPSSTAVSLAYNKPYIYRFVPADDKQGPAMAKEIYSLGVRYIVPIWQDTAYGNGLLNYTEHGFTALGGNYDPYTNKYDPIATTDFSSQVNILAQHVQTAVNTYGESQVGVYAVTYEEIESIMYTAASNPAYAILTHVRWFGCDGSAESEKLSGDATAAALAVNTTFPAAYFAPPNSSILQQVQKTLTAQLGHNPDTYAYSLYDSLWVAAKSIALAQQYNGAADNKVFGAAANATYGASGWTVLNSYNDRLIADYQFWQVYKANATTYNWYLAGMYTGSTATITTYPKP